VGPKRGPVLCGGPNPGPLLCVWPNRGLLLYVGPNRESLLDVSGTALLPLWRLSGGGGQTGSQVVVS
jgi:hypothetical protein